jgi:hypothetical protein
MHLWWNLTWVFALLWVVAFFVRGYLAKSIREELNNHTGSMGLLLSKHNGTWVLIEDRPDTEFDVVEGAQFMVSWGRSQGVPSPTEWLRDVSPYEATTAVIRYGGPPAWLTQEAKRLASTIANGAKPWPLEVTIDPATLNLPGLEGEAIEMIHNGTLQKTHWSWRLFPTAALFVCQWALLVVALVSLRASSRVRRLHQRIERNHCPVCDYPLGHIDSCSECGTALLRDRSSGKGP